MPFFTPYLCPEVLFTERLPWSLISWACNGQDGSLRVAQLFLWKVHLRNSARILVLDPIPTRSTNWLLSRRFTSSHHKDSQSVLWNWFV
jgi:hypothetical protein